MDREAVHDIVVESMARSKTNRDIALIEKKAGIKLFFFQKEYIRRLLDMSFEDLNRFIIASGRTSSVSAQWLYCLSLALGASQVYDPSRYRPLVKIRKSRKPNRFRRLNWKREMQKMKKGRPYDRNH